MGLGQFDFPHGVGLQPRVQPDAIEHIKERQGACLGPTARGGADVVQAHLEQEIVEMALDRLDGFLQDEEQDHGKGEQATAGEICGQDAVAGLEGGVVEALARGLDQVDEVRGDGGGNMSHPHCN
jgi:hypothetical protein